MSDLRARLSTALGPIPPGSLVPRDWVVSLIDGFDESDDIDLTVPEVATRLDRGESTIRTMLADGRLEGYRLNGREWRVPRSALRALRYSSPPPPSSPSPRDGVGSPELSDWRVHLKNDAPPGVNPDRASDASARDRQDREGPHV